MSYYELESTLYRIRGQINSLKGKQKDELLRNALLVRLNKSLKTYEHELEMSQKYISYRNPMTMVKKLLTKAN